MTEPTVAAQSAGQPAVQSATSQATARKKCTIQDIRESKRSGEKMVYMSVPDDAPAKWAAMAAMAVVGDSPAMIADGHASTIPATMGKHV